MAKYYWSDSKKEIKLFDVIGKGDFWGGFIMGGLIIYFGFILVWGASRLLTGNSSDIETMSIETGNFMGLLSFGIACWKSYSKVYGDLYKARQECIDRERELGIE